MASSVDKATNDMTYDGMLGALKNEDWISIFAPLVNDGYQWDAMDEKLIRPTGKMGRFLSYNTPWMHVKGSPFKSCTFDHHVCFNHYGIIPPKCLECWKVVVTPNTFHQLMQLEDIERGGGRSCKLGIELRAYTPKHYGGYFYNNSLDEGRECYEWVRNAINDHMDDGKDVDVILKRGCTEYEFIKGPSPYWIMTPEEEMKYELLAAFVEEDRSNSVQPTIVQKHVKLRWAQWAHSHGDMTYVDYNGGKPLYPGYVKYHEGDIDGIKQDLATARAEAKLGMPHDLASEFQTLAKEWADDHEVPVTALIHALGAHETNPLKHSSFFDVPKEAIGDEDQST